MPRVTGQPWGRILSRPSNHDVCFFIDWMDGYHPLIEECGFIHSCGGFLGGEDSSPLSSTYFGIAENGIANCNVVLT